jgi:hypothetical protein
LVEVGNLVIHCGANLYVPRKGVRAAKVAEVECSGEHLRIANPLQSGEPALPGDDSRPLLATPKPPLGRTAPSAHDEPKDESDTRQAPTGSLAERCGQLGVAANHVNAEEAVVERLAVATPDPVACEENPTVADRGGDQHEMSRECERRGLGKEKRATEKERNRQEHCARHAALETERTSVLVHDAQTEPAFAKGVPSGERAVLATDVGQEKEQPDPAAARTQGNELGLVKGRQEFGNQPKDNKVYRGGSQPPTRRREHGSVEVLEGIRRGHERLWLSQGVCSRNERVPHESLFGGLVGRVERRKANTARAGCSRCWSSLGRNAARRNFWSSYTA